MRLTLENITKSFGEKEVLRDINISAQSGKALGLLGRNGAGKTTTIRIIMGVFFPDSGRVLVDGEPIDRNKLTLGYLPEERGMYPKKLISDQLLYFGRLKGLSKADAKASADYWLERLEMTEYANKKLETLSKGNQQKIQLAATVMGSPDIVILDEPFSGLDPVNALLLKDVIKEVIEKGSTVLFSSHQMNYIEEFCEDICILNSGNIVLDGNINEIKRGYRRDSVAVTSQQIDRLCPYIAEKFASQILSAEKDEKNNERLVVKLKEPDSKSELLKLLAQSDIDIDSISVCEPSLNDIFVEYTEGGI